MLSKLLRFFFSFFVRGSKLGGLDTEIWGGTSSPRPRYVDKHGRCERSSDLVFGELDYLTSLRLFHK